MKSFEISDAARYKVLLAFPVTVDGAKLLPRDKHKMSGETLRQITDENGWEAIADADNLL